MRRVLPVLTALTLAAVTAGADITTQTDWAGGGGEGGPVTDWRARFDSESGVSWRSVPGQLALSSVALTPVEHLVDNDYSGSFGIHAADVDRDGDTDILGASDNSGVVSLWLNDGANPPHWTEQIIDGAFPGANTVFAVDVDGDGAEDVVGSAAAPSNQVVWWRNGGGNPIVWTRTTIEASWPEAWEINAGDLDQDGDPDVLSTSYNAGKVKWWRNDGGSPVQWIPQEVDGSFAGAHSVCFADLDGDGDNDLAGAGALANQVVWWRNDRGDPIVWVKQTITSSFIGARSVRAGDVDGDGRADIVGTSWTKHVAWWRNADGDPTQWTQQIIDSDFAGGHSIQVADVDGDGDLDAVGAGVNCHDVRWWENGGGSPITWTRRLVDSDYTNAIEVHTGDMDGDGDIDILATSYYWGEFTWWSVARFQSSGQLTGSILDTEIGPLGAYLSWSADQPAGTSLAFRVRSSDDPAAMGSWSSDIGAPGMLTIPVHRYLQYQAVFGTTDPAMSPILREVTIDPGVNPAGATDVGPSGSRTVRWGRNPCRGSIRTEVETHDPCAVTLRIFDVEGREITAVREGTARAGVRHLDTGELRAGVYFCRVEAGAVLTSQRMVLLP